MMNNKKIPLLYIISAIIFSTVISSAVYAVDIDYYSSNDILYYNSEACVTTSNSSSSSSVNSVLPATSGKTGLEEAVDKNGITTGTKGKISTGSTYVSKGQAWQDYYITMRWTNWSWDWIGTPHRANSDQESPFGHIVLVTNPVNGKSIYAVAAESGPAPWTGVDRYSNNDAKQGWVNPQIGTPITYTGRVSGLPPVAYNYLEAEMGTYDGSGTVLYYQWATDQSVTPGPTTETATSTGTTNCGSTDNKHGYNLEDMVYYNQTDSQWASSAFGGTTVGKGGCGPTSVAMIIATLTNDKTINPTNIASFYASHGGYCSNSRGSCWNWEVFQDYYDVSVTKIDTNIEAAKSALDEGGLVLASWSGAPFTGGGHLLVIRKYDNNGNIYIASSGGTLNYQQSQEAWDESIFTNGWDGTNPDNNSVGNRTGKGYLKGLWVFKKK